MTRVFVVAPTSAARAALAARCRSAGLEVLGVGRSLDAQPPRADVFVVLDDDGEIVVSRVGEPIASALVLMSDEPSAVRRAAASGADGWAVVPTAASSEDLAAAVKAVVRGFAVAQPTRLSRAALSLAADWDDDVPEERLTPREQEVLELVAHGRSNRRIAAALGISEHTVKFHLASIYGKLGASTRTEAVRRGLRRGLIEI